MIKNRDDCFLFAGHFCFILSMFFPPLSFQVHITSTNRLKFLLNLTVVAHFLFYHRYYLSHCTLFKLSLIVLITTCRNFARPKSTTRFYFATVNRLKKFYLTKIFSIFFGIIDFYLCICRVLGFTGRGLLKSDSHPSLLVVENFFNSLLLL